MYDSHRHNGLPQATKTVNGRLAREFRRPKDRQRSSAGPTQSALPADDDGLGLAIRPKHPTAVLALGTTACQTAHLVMNIVRRDNGGSLPAQCDYLLTDAEAPQPAWDSRHVPKLPVLGSAGAGTNPNEGKRIIEEAWPALRACLAAVFDRICMAAGAGQADGAQHNIIDLWLLAGCGGTSGGMLDLAISLVHQVARERGIAIRVYLVLLGPLVALLDRNRKVLPEQFQVVKATFGSNLVKVVANLQDATWLHVVPPDGADFDIRLCERVQTIFVADRSNGRVHYGTVDEFQQMLADALTLRIFTQVAWHFDSRTQDAEKLGVHDRALTGDSP